MLKVWNPEMLFWCPRLDVNNEKVCNMKQKCYVLSSSFGWFCDGFKVRSHLLIAPFSLFDWVSPQLRRNAFSRAMMAIIGYLHYTEMDSPKKKIIKKTKSPLESDSSEQIKIKSSESFPGNILIRMILWWWLWTWSSGQIIQLICDL